MRRSLPIALVLVVALGGCAAEAPEPAAPPVSSVRSWGGWEPAVVDSGLVLESTDFTPGGDLPASIENNRYGCDGPNTRPELHWSGVPEGTKSIVVTFTAEGGGPTNRWAAFNIDPTVTSLPAAPGDAAPEGAELAAVSSGSTAMLGPCSLSGESWELWFIVYALDTVIDEKTGVDVISLTLAGQGHVLASAELAGIHSAPAE